MIALLIVLATFIWMSSVWIVLILIRFKRPWIAQSFWCCLATCRPRLALDELGRPVPLSTLRWSRLGRNLCKLFGLWYYEILYLSFATFADVFRGSFVWWWSYRSCNSLAAVPVQHMCWFRELLQLCSNYAKYANYSNCAMNPYYAYYESYAAIVQIMQSVRIAWIIQAVHII